MRRIRRKTFPVIPAKAGIHGQVAKANSVWVPACAGTTGKPGHEIRTLAPALKERAPRIAYCANAFQLPFSIVSIIRELEPRPKWSVGV